MYVRIYSVASCFTRQFPKLEHLYQDENTIFYIMDKAIALKSPVYEGKQKTEVESE